MTSSSQFPTGTWTLDPEATIVTVSVKKLGLFTIPATLKVLSGTIDIGDNHQVTNVEIVADASSYRSKNAKRNEHVAGSDFIDADAHPTITFRSSQVTPSNSGFTSNGTITLKGRTTPIEVAVVSVDTTDTSGSFAATATVDRNVIGVDKMPSIVIGALLDITVNATATRNP